MTIEQIARIAHEANRSYCHSINDHSQTQWGLAPQWQKDSAINGVIYHRDHPDSKPEDSHVSWLAEKLANGWKYGPVKDPDKKEHPCCVPYSELPEAQKVKDHLFVAVVRALIPFLTEE